MVLPKLTHLEFLILLEIEESPKIGKDILEQINWNKGGGWFNQTMKNIVTKGYCSNSHSDSGKIYIDKTSYSIEEKGLTELENSRKFYKQSENSTKQKID